MAAVIALLVGESLAGLGVQNNGPPILVHASLGPDLGGGVAATYQLQSRSLTLTAHLALLASGGKRSYSGIFVLVDPSFPALYSDYPDLTAVPGRVASLLDLMGVAIPVQGILGSQVVKTLDSNPNGVLVILGTPAPDSILSPVNHLLPEWVRAGGTLVWAGGPLGFSAGHPDGTGSFAFEDLGWQGQVTLAGYAVTDVARVAPRGTPTGVPPPPLVAANQTVFSTALAIQYAGTADGANVSEVTAHRGVALGLVATPAGPVGVGARTSLAYLPQGSGGIYYFGGADLSSYQAYVPYASGWVTSGSVEVASDIAELIGLQSSPVAGPVTSSDVLLSPGRGVSETLFLSNYSGAAALLVRSGADWSLFVLWGEAVACPGQRARPDARPREK